MKTLVFFSLFILFTSSIYAQEIDLNFSDVPLKTALHKAKSSEKPVFIQFMAENCSSCDMMTDVWRSREVAAIYANNFILMNPTAREKSNLEKKYEISNYPTFIFLDTKGKLIHKFQGLTNEFDMVDNAQRVMDNKRTLAYYNMASASKDIQFTPEDLLDYAKVLLKAGEPYKKVARKYFDTQEEPVLIEPNNIQAILLFSDNIYSREILFIAKHIGDMQEKDRVDVIFKIEDVFSDAIMQSIVDVEGEESRAIFEDTLGKMVKSFPFDYLDLLITRVNMDYYESVDPKGEFFFSNLEAFMQIHSPYLTSALVIEKCEKLIMYDDNNVMVDRGLEWIREVKEQGQSTKGLLNVEIELLIKAYRFQEARDVIMVYYQGYANDGAEQADSMTQEQKVLLQKINKAETESANKRK